MSNFKLRPHHALCIQNFRGKGYSDDFTRNMEYVIHTLEQNNPIVNLSSKTDILCSHCLHNLDGQCRSYTHVFELDQRVLQYCGLEENQNLNWKNLKQTAYNLILTSKNFQKICYDCSWYEFCQSIVNEK